jgi:hypothetical protein
MRPRRKPHEENFVRCLDLRDRLGRYGLCQIGPDRAADRRRQTAIKALGCTIEDSDITVKGDGYKADDVECKDGQYDMTLDKDLLEPSPGMRE